MKHGLQVADRAVINRLSPALAGQIGDNCEAVPGDRHDKLRIPCLDNAGKASEMLLAFLKLLQAGFQQRCRHGSTGFAERIGM